MKIWKYNRCGSCRKAVKFLDEHGAKYEAIDILDTPPSKEELLKMLGYMDGNLKKLFNVSGVQYREGKYKDKINSMGIDEAMDELSKNGALIKRPFLLTKGKGIVGFKEEVWEDIIK